MKKTIANLMKRKKSGRGYIQACRCRVCTKNFWLSEHKVLGGLGKYCSKKCYGLARTGIKKPTLGPKISKTKQLKSIKTIKKCEVCNLEWITTPGAALKRRTCSRRCAGSLNSSRLRQMWKNPPIEMIDKMRQAMVKRRSSGRLEKETKPEKIMREELERRGIKFEAQFGYEGLCVADFFIPHLQAFIFCDGSYWHGLLSSREKDWQQVQFLRAKGMKAYRFTDKEIDENIKKCVDIIIEDTKQLISIGEIIDRYLILSIKKDFVTKDKLQQVLKDYRRMEKVVLASLQYCQIKKAQEILELIKGLSTTNCEIYMLVDKVQKDEHTREDATKLQSLNTYRSKLMNAINEYFDEEQIIKT